jgi:hypothetical protein
MICSTHSSLLCRPECVCRVPTPYVGHYLRIARLARTACAGRDQVLLAALPEAAYAQVTAAKEWYSRPADGIPERALNDVLKVVKHRFSSINSLAIYSCPSVCVCIDEQTED